MLIDTDLKKMRYGNKMRTAAAIVKISAVNDPILVKCGKLTQNDMTIMAMRSKSKLKKMTD